MKKQLFVFLGIIIFVGSIPFYQLRAEELSTKLKGRILLQVESKGEAWYVNPKDSKRYYMVDGDAAYNIMRNLGVGITNKDLDKIKADKNLAKKNQGKIFLQIESKGEAYYIDANGNTHYLKDGAAAYLIMRQLGLGIKNADLIKILAFDKNKATSSTTTIAVFTYDVKITSSTCDFVTGTDQYGNSLNHIRAITSGTVQGPVGTRLELPILVWSDDKWSCGDWTYSSGAWIAVGDTCTRQEGQPETSTWSVDTGGEEQGDFLKGKTRTYTAKIYKKGSIFSEKVASTTYTCQ